MVLIKCSECKKELSDRADKCPHCGNPITIQPEKKEKKTLNPKGIRLDV